jgi:hypothetical protein
LDVWDSEIWVAVWVGWNRGVDSVSKFVKEETRGEMLDAGES